MREVGPEFRLEELGADRSWEGVPAVGIVCTQTQKCEEVTGMAHSEKSVECC